MYNGNSAITPTSTGSSLFTHIPPRVIYLYYSIINSFTKDGYRNRQILHLGLKLRDNSHGDTHDSRVNRRVKD